MTAPGELNRRLAIEAPVETPDGAGGVTRTYQTTTTVWAQVTPVGARGDVVAASLGATVTHRIVIRPGPDISVRHRLRDGTRVFAVRSVRERESGRFVEIAADERTD